MSLSLDPASDHPDAKRIIAEAAYYVVDRCAGYDDFYPVVRESFYAGVGMLGGAEAEAAVRRDGLGKLHLHFPTEKVLLLEAYVESSLRGLLYEWSRRVGREDLKLADPFYIDHLIVIRIHFPYEVAKKARSAQQPRRPVAEVMSHAASALREPRILINQASRALRRPRQKSAYEPGSFHGPLVKPARSHGAHIDTWYGHSFDGINLWWSIEGVNALNSVILYPDMAGRPVRYDPRSMYLAPGIPVSEPRTIDLKPGALLLFNPETLHSTHVNISDETRVALTTRINPGQPKFYNEAPFNFEHWHSSTDIEKGRMSAMKVFPALKYQGTATLKARPPFENGKTIHKVLPQQLGKDEATVCASSDLLHGMKLAVTFDDAKLMLWRTEDGSLRAFSRLCPHVGVDLADGWHNDKAIHCPGHGLAFDLHTGSSACASLRLAEFDTAEQDGVVRVRVKRKPLDRAAE